MAQSRKPNLLRGTIIAAAVAIAGGGAGGLVYWNHLSEQRERHAFEKINMLGDEQNSVGQSYARTLSGIERLRTEFRKLVESNPEVPTNQLRALADETTLEVIKSQDLSSDVDTVVQYVADLDGCIAERRCDPRVATGHQSPLAALRNWEQWYRPYLDLRRDSAPDRESAFYRYLSRAPA
jgi:hypothetical protein